MKSLIVTVLSKLGLTTSARIVYAFYASCVYNKKIIETQVAWRSLNRHNHTTAGNINTEMIFPLAKVSVGKHCYGPLRVHHFGTVGEKLTVGNYCSISIGVIFILGGNHSINTFSTYPFRHFFNNGECEAWTKGPIVVEDDVWIGTNSIILSGVTLGKGTIVAAGSVVTATTLPYSVVGGNPAKLIKRRFNDALVDLLMDVDFGMIDETRIFSLLPKLDVPLNGNLLLEIKQDLLESSYPNISKAN